MKTAIYCRVSSTSQDTRSQEMELERWAKAQDVPIVWFKDKATGKTMSRPGLEKLLKAVHSGDVKRVVVWRLDRLGRTAKGLLDLFDEFDRLNINFVSLKDALDTSTPAGKLMRTILSAVAQFETEVRSERQRAGIEAAKEANGGTLPWGGRKKGTKVKVTPEKEEAIKEMFKNKEPVSKIAKVVGLGRQTVYRTLGLWER